MTKSTKPKTVRKPKALFCKRMLARIEVIRRSHHIHYYHQEAGKASYLISSENNMQRVITISQALQNNLQR